MAIRALVQSENVFQVSEIVRALVDDQRFTIEQLMAHVTGSYGNVANDIDPPSTALEVSGNRMLRRAANE